MTPTQVNLLLEGWQKWLDADNQRPGTTNRDNISYWSRNYTPAIVEMLMYDAWRQSWEEAVQECSVSAATVTRFGWVAYGQFYDSLDEIHRTYGKNAQVVEVYK